LRIKQGPAGRDQNSKKQGPEGFNHCLFQPLLPEDEDFPKGFYLRKMDGSLCRSGYACPMDYI